jgi:membrane protein
VRGVVTKFYADRGTHLAAMIAYFALLAFVPLTFLSLSLLGFAGRADESSFLVNEIKHVLPPETPIEDIVRLVRTVQDNAATLGILGGAFLLWTALSFFSVLESAFNIVYGEPNRGFLHGKGIAVALMIGSLVTLFLALLAGSLSIEGIRRILPGVAGDDLVIRGFSIAISTLGAFVFTTSSYYLLTNVSLRPREVFPGGILAAALLQLSFQVLPLFNSIASLNPVLQTFGSPVILLVWFYVMSNVIVFGAELNWWLFRRQRKEETEAVPGLA